MDERASAPDSSSPTVQKSINRREAEDEKQPHEPLLGSVEARRKDFQDHPMQDSRLDVVRRMKHWNWKNLVVLTSLWFAYCALNCANSVIGPFFPNEVRSLLKSLSHI